MTEDLLFRVCISDSSSLHVCMSGENKDLIMSMVLNCSD